MLSLTLGVVVFVVLLMAHVFVNHTVHQTFDVDFPLYSSIAKATFALVEDDVVTNHIKHNSNPIKHNI